MSKTYSELQAAVTPTIKITIEAEDGSASKVWRLCLDYRALGGIEAQLRKHLKNIESRKNLSSGKDYPQIVHCCLARYNPEVTLDDVLNDLSPSVQRPLSDALFTVAFPEIGRA